MTEGLSKHEHREVNSKPNAFVGQNTSISDGHGPDIEFSNLESPEVKMRVVTVVCAQLYAPSHVDRIKSLFILKKILHDAANAALIPDHCWERVNLVAEQSILENGGVAKTLQKHRT